MPPAALELCHLPRDGCRFHGPIIFLTNTRVIVHNRDMQTLLSLLTLVGRLFGESDSITDVGYMVTLHFALTETVVSHDAPCGVYRVEYRGRTVIEYLQGYRVRILRDCGVSVSREHWALAY